MGLSWQGAFLDRAHFATSAQFCVDLARWVKRFLDRQHKAYFPNLESGCTVGAAKMGLSLVIVWDVLSIFWYLCKHFYLFYGLVLAGII